MRRRGHLGIARRYPARWSAVPPSAAPRRVPASRDGGPARRPVPRRIPAAPGRDRACLVSSLRRDKAAGPGAGAATVRASGARESSSTSKDVTKGVCSSSRWRDFTCVPRVAPSSRRKGLCVRSSGWSPTDPSPARLPAALAVSCCSRTSRGRAREWPRAWPRPASNRSVLPRRAMPARPRMLGLVLPAEPAARRAFLDEVLAKEGPWQGVVLLSGLDASAGAEIRDRRPPGGRERAAGERPRLAQAMASREDSPPPRCGWSAVAPVRWSRRRNQGIGRSPTRGTRSGLRGSSTRACARTGVDLDPAATRSARSGLVAELLADDDEMDVAFRDGARLVSRVRPVTAAFPAEPTPQLLRKSPGRLIEELAFGPSRGAAPGPGEVEIRVRAAGLNFRDVLNALGLYPGSRDSPWQRMRGRDRGRGGTSWTGSR